MWWSALTRTTALLGSFAVHAPSHRLWLADYGPVEKAVLCAIMTITTGVDWGSLWQSVKFFGQLFLLGFGGGPHDRKTPGAQPH